jgi:hypothetical protein
MSTACTACPAGSGRGATSSAPKAIGRASSIDTTAAGGNATLLSLQEEN